MSGLRMSDFNSFSLSGNDAVDYGPDEFEFDYHLYAQDQDFTAEVDAYDTQAAEVANDFQTTDEEEIAAGAQVDPEDEFLIIAENYHDLKSRVPDANNQHLWGLAKDCFKKADSAAEYANDLIVTGDYPIEESTDSFYGLFQQSEDKFKAAVKYSSLRAILPDADATYVWETANDHINSNDDVFNRFVLHLQETGDYPKSNLSELTSNLRVELKKNEMAVNAQKILNLIDSQYIQEQLNDPSVGLNEAGVGQLILNLTEKNNVVHPSKTEEYYRKMTQEAIHQYSDNFDIEKFLLIVPEPVQFFENPSNPIGPKYQADLFKYLRAVVQPHVTNVRIRQIQKQHRTVLNCHRSFFGQRVPLETIQYKLTDEGFRFINELTYLRFYEEIVPTAAVYASLLDTGSQSNSGDFFEEECLSCELCEELVQPNKAMTCSEAHIFCIECVHGWVNERFSQGRVEINCLMTCTGTIPDKVLACVINAHAFEKFKQRRQDHEVGAAQIDGIQNCHWCDYRYVPRIEDKDLVCLDPRCGERWCRKCKQVAHYPKPCEDTPEEVKKRVYIEERMTNALVKQCPTCKVDIVKTDGCDLVTCICGTSLCYKCGEVSQQHHCPKIQVIRTVQSEGVKAKADADVLFPNVALNYDPTR